MKVKVKLFNTQTPFKFDFSGDWIDLKTADSIIIEGPTAQTLKKSSDGNSNRKVNFNTTLIPLGIAMELPKGYEAVVLPRSSTFKNYNILPWNSQGVIDNTYNGNDDQWHFPVIAFASTVIPMHTRIAQFKIQLSQHATSWQKIKWLFSNKIKFVYVNNLNIKNRGGFGSTGTN